MKYTSAQANKLLKKLNDTYHALLQEEEQSSTFLAAMGEDPETLRPDYVYADTQDSLWETERQILTVKHAINVFNATHTLEGFDLTIDQALVYIPMLSGRVKKLAEMKARLPKAREKQDRYSGVNILDYRHINYDRAAAAADYEKAFDELCRLQTALDTANNTETLEISL